MQNRQQNGLKQGNVAVHSQKDAARRRQAREQFALIDQMCAETGLSLSALAKEAGFGNSTFTRARSLGRPIKNETFQVYANTYAKIMSNKGLTASENVLRYESRYGFIDEMIATDPTPDRLKLAIHTAGEDFNLQFSDNDLLRDLSAYVAELYRVIVDEEDKTGTAIPDDVSGRATLRRTFAARREQARRAATRDTPL